MLAPAMLKLPVSEYAPNTVKKAVVGAGHAEKDQVKHMVKLLLPKARMRTADSTDALAVAICHAHYRGSQRLADILARS
jgi:crossover junction endodeoxyribonuclease RuvC